MEYDALARVIAEQPDRQQTEARLAELKAQLETLQVPTVLILNARAFPDPNFIIPGTLLVSSCTSRFVLVSLGWVSGPSLPVSVP